MSFRPLLGILFAIVNIYFWYLLLTFINADLFILYVLIALTIFDTILMLKEIRGSDE